MVFIGCLKWITSWFWPMVSSLKMVLMMSLSHTRDPLLSFCRPISWTQTTELMMTVTLLAMMMKTVSILSLFLIICKEKKLFCDGEENVYISTFLYFARMVLNQWFPHFFSMPPPFVPDYILSISKSFIHSFCSDIPSFPSPPHWIFPMTPRGQYCPLWESLF